MVFFVCSVLIIGYVFVFVRFFQFMYKCLRLYLVVRNVVSNVSIVYPFVYLSL